MPPIVLGERTYGELRRKLAEQPGPTHGHAAAPAAKQVTWIKVTGGLDTTTIPGHSLYPGVVSIPLAGGGPGWQDLTAPVWLVPTNFVHHHFTVGLRYPAVRIGDQVAGGRPKFLSWHQVSRTDYRVQYIDGSTLGPLWHTHAGVMVVPHGVWWVSGSVTIHGSLTYGGGSGNYSLVSQFSVASGSLSAPLRAPFCGGSLGYLAPGGSGVLSFSYVTYPVHCLLGVTAGATATLNLNHQVLPAAPGARSCNIAVNLSRTQLGTESTGSILTAMDNLS